jgi:hypothetical protein
MAIGYWLYLAPYGRDAKYAIICVPGFVFTVWGWRRAERLLVADGECRAPAEGVTHSPVKFQVPTGRGGLAFLLGRIAVYQLGAALLGLVLVFAWNLVASNGKLWPNFSDSWFFVIWVPVMLTMRHVCGLLLSLRYLRTLPLTSRQIAILFLLATLLPVLFIGPALAALVGAEQGARAGLSLGKACLLSMAPVCVLTTAAVWRGERRPDRILVAVTVLAISMIAPIYQVTTNGMGCSWLYAIAYPLIFLVLAVWAISYLIERNDLAYHQRVQAEAEEMDRAGWGAGF